MKTALRLSMIVLLIVMIPTLVYFFVTGVLLSVVTSLCMFALCAIMLCTQIWQEREDGEPRSKFYFRFFLIMMVAQAIVTIALIASGNFTLVWRDLFG